MKKFFALMLIILISGCKTTEKVKYIDREVLVPKIIVEYCGVDIIPKCQKYIDDNKDLIECYIFNKNKIEEANEIIKLCKEKTKKG